MLITFYQLRATLTLRARHQRQKRTQQQLVSWFITWFSVLCNVYDFQNWAISKTMSYAISVLDIFCNCCFGIRVLCQHNNNTQRRIKARYSSDNLTNLRLFQKQVRGVMNPTLQERMLRRTQAWENAVMMTDCQHTILRAQHRRTGKQCIPTDILHSNQVCLVPLKVTDIDLWLQENVLCHD